MAGALALLAPLALAGCGSAASDAGALGRDARPAPYAGRITIASVPAGARCVLTNMADGARVAEVTTPAEVALPRGTAAIETRCTAPGHMETVRVLRPVRDFAADVHHPQPIGTGAVQNAVAVRTGSTRRYLDATIRLPPASFASSAERDAWFDALAADLRGAAAPWIARAERAPNATIDTAETLRGHLSEDLVALETLRGAASVASPARGR
jgi:hypothetical protein